MTQLVIDLFQHSEESWREKKRVKRKMFSLFHPASYFYLARVMKGPVIDEVKEGHGWDFFLPEQQGINILLRGSFTLLLKIKH